MNNDKTLKCRKCGGEHLTIKCGKENSNKLNDNKKFSKGKLISEYEDDKNFDLKVMKKRDK